MPKVEENRPKPSGHQAFKREIAQKKSLKQLTQWLVNIASKFY